MNKINYKVKNIYNKQENIKYIFNEKLLKLIVSKQNNIYERIK